MENVFLEVNKKVNGLKGLERMQAAQSFLYEKYSTMSENASQYYMNFINTDLDESDIAFRYINECINLTEVNLENN